MAVIKWCEITKSIAVACGSGDTKLTSNGSRSGQASICCNPLLKAATSHWRKMAQVYAQVPLTFTFKKIILRRK